MKRENNNLYDTYKLITFEISENFFFRRGWKEYLDEQNSQNGDQAEIDMIEYIRYINKNNENEDDKDVLKDKLQLIYERLFNLPNEHQKGIILLLLPDFKEYFLMDEYEFLVHSLEYFYPEMFDNYIAKINNHWEFISYRIKDDLTYYYCTLLSGKPDQREVITVIDYVAILGQLGLIQHFRYEEQSEYFYNLIDNHEMFNFVRVINPKVKTIHSNLKKYESTAKDTIFKHATSNANKYINKYKLKKF